VTSWRLIPSSDPAQWDEAVARCGDHDVYHLAGYHRVPTPLAGAAAAWLFTIEHAGEHVAVPFLVRPISVGSDYDATSAYGYPGVICSVSAPNDLTVAAFQCGLGEAFDEFGVITWFGRQHPLFNTDWLLEDAAEVIGIGQTIAIDLTPTEAELQALANNNHRRNLRKAEALGVTVVEDRRFERIAMFRGLYDATMIRNGAPAEYLFPESYYAALKAELGDRVTMFHAMVDDRVASSVIMFRHRGIVQYHLGGTHEDFATAGTARFLLEHVRRWAKANGDRWYHLGGGVGSTEDSLFRFKAGFAKTFKRYRIVKWIQNEERYRDLTGARRGKQPPPTEGFFPAYRG
jgi:GNAT superfamily N-acetyltransferase